MADSKAGSKDGSRVVSRADQSVPLKVDLWVDY
jgi:hypothetical protein